MRVAWWDVAVCVIRDVTCYLPQKGGDALLDTLDTEMEGKGLTVNLSIAFVAGKTAVFIIQVSDFYTLSQNLRLPGGYFAGLYMFFFSDFPSVARS